MFEWLLINLLLVDETKMIFCEILLRFYGGIYRRNFMSPPACLLFQKLPVNGQTRKQELEMSSSYVTVGQRMLLWLNDQSPKPRRR